MGFLSDLETLLQQALDEKQTQCVPCGLLKHRHHRYLRSIMINYGEIQLRIPVFRCVQSREMSSGVSLLGEEERYRRYSRNHCFSCQAGGPGFDLPTGRRFGR